MIPDIAEVIHHYLGCEFIYTFNDGEKVSGVLDMISKSGSFFGDVKFEDGTKEWIEIHDIREDGKIQLLLKHPNEMTAEQKKEYISLCKVITTAGGEEITIDTPNSLHYLCKNYIDAFDLIDRNLAWQIPKSITEPYPLEGTWKERITFVLKALNRPLTTEEIVDQVMLYESKSKVRIHNAISTMLTQHMKYLVRVKYKGRSYKYTLPS